MIEREVISPPLLSRLAIVFLIALVAATGALACASFVASERAHGSAFDPCVACPGCCIGNVARGTITPYRAGNGVISGTTHHEIGTFGTVAGAYRIPPHETRIAVEIVVGDVSYFFGIDSSDGTHHDAAVCRERLAIGSDDCLYFDEARTP